MKIGIISKKEHSKNHVQALRKDGYEVVELGGGPVSNIPDSLDCVIIRTESCGHGGSDSAYAWARTNGKPIIVENGLSGIRRELESLITSNGYMVRFEWALDVLKTNRDSDSDEDYREALRHMGAPAPLIEVLVPLKDEEEPVEDPEEEVEDQEEFGQWTGGLPGEYPSSRKWTKAVPKDRLIRELRATQALWNTTPESTFKVILDTFCQAMAAQSGPFFPEVPEEDHEWHGVRALKGKPNRFYLLLIRVVQGSTILHRKALEQAYVDFCGKRTDYRVLEAAAWVNGADITQDKTMFAPSVEPDESPEPKGALVIEPPEVKRDIDNSLESLLNSSPKSIDEEEDLTLEERLDKLRGEMEDYILELMGSHSEWDRENKALKKKVGELEEAVTSLTAELKEVKDSIPGLIAEARVDVILDELEKTAPAPRELGTSDVQASVDALRRRGAKVTIEFEPLDD